MSILSKTKPGILLVEDSLIVAYHLQTTLESEGYRVLGKCDSGEKAVQFAEANKPDLVLMDVMLTGKLDGIETASIFKLRFDIPVIYITSLTDKDTIDRAKITEPYGYLKKPFEDREIFTVIEMALYKHRIETLMREMERQRKEALIEGQEKERARIAKDMHDGLGQMLNAIKMNVKVVIKDRHDAASISRLLDEAIQESVRISENLLPSKLRDFDLATCLKSLCAQMRATTFFTIHFYKNGVLPALDQSKKVNLYRIAQEALHNAMKHSNASHITVQLSNVGEVLRLSIEDDGKGIDSVGIVRQSGLMNMKDRAEVVGGKLIVESDSERGTLIIAEIPMNTPFDNE